MNHPAQQLKLLFVGSVIGLGIWCMSPSAHAGLSSKPSNFMPIPSYEATYVVSWHGIKGGESEHRLLQRKDGLYHISTVSTPFLKILPFKYVEKTDFAIEEGHVLPQNYYYNIKEGSRHKQGNVHFDWAKNKVSNLLSHEPWEANLSEGIQDKLTHALSLRLDLIEGKQPKTTYTYTVAEDDEIKDYTFTVLSTENLETQMGTLETLKVDLVSSPGKHSHMWLSIKDSYLPVQVHHFKEGKKVGSGKIKSYRPKNTTHS